MQATALRMTSRTSTSWLNIAGENTVGGHCYHYVLKNHEDELYNFEAVCGAGDQYLVLKVLSKWSTITRIERWNCEVEQRKSEYGLGPETPAMEVTPPRACSAWQKLRSTTKELRHLLQ